MITPENTPLDRWLSIWIFHKIEEICDRKKLLNQRFTYTGLSAEKRRALGLPTSRAEGIEFIRQHEGDKYD